MKSKITAVVLVVLITAVSLISAAPISSKSQTTAVGEVQDLVGGIVGYQLYTTGAASEQSWIDGALTAGAGATSEWYVLALAQSGEAYDFSRYCAALTSYLESSDAYSASSRQKYALVLAATGSKDSYIASVMEDSIGKQGIMSYVYGLHLLNNGYTSSSATIDSVKEQLLSWQRSDGGWAITGNVSDVDVTAMTVQALASHYKTDAVVRGAVDRAVSLLSSRQLENGDFASYGVANAESTAQVITALSSLGIDCESDSRFAKNGNTPLDGLRRYVLADGSVCHKLDGGSNHNATVQTFYSLIAYLRMAQGKGGLYNLDHANVPTPTAWISAVTTAVSMSSISHTHLTATVTAVPTDPVVVTTTVQPTTATQRTTASSILSAISDNVQTSHGIGYKPIVTVVVLILAGGACLLLFVLKKRHQKNFIVVLVLAAAVIAFVWITTFSSTGDYYGGTVPAKDNTVGTVTLLIGCDTIVGKTDAAHIPLDGVILAETAFAIEDGDTVYDILVEAAKANGIHMENSGQNGMVYIAGIHNIYQFDFGELSGWMYFVNGEEASVGCDAYTLSDGDRIEWLYTCELGNDLR